MSAEDILDQIERKREERNRRCDEAPSTLVEGFIGASAPGGFGSGSDMRLGVSLDCWRSEGDALEEGKLYIHHPIDEDDLGRYRSVLRPWTQVRYRVRLDPQRSEYRGKPRSDARGEELVAHDLKIPEFAELIRNLQRPVVVQHPKLGRLTLDREFGAFVGKRRRWFRQYDIEVEASPDDSCDLEALWQSVKQVENDINQVLDAIADEYLEDYKGWGSPLGPLSREKFKSKPRLSSLTVDSAGIELYLKDGGLFLGHLFRVHIKDGQVDSVGLEG